jgi:hypothetical protein
VKIYAFDPGSVATGVACYVNDEYWGARQFTDPVHAWEWFENDWAHSWDQSDEDMTLVEDYRSGGHMTAHAKNTIEVVGYLKLSLRSAGYPFQMRVEQHRLSGNNKADQLLKARGVLNPESNNWKDARSALAHCITWHRQYVERR